MADCMAGCKVPESRAAGRVADKADGTAAGTAPDGTAAGTAADKAGSTAAGTARKEEETVSAPLPPPERRRPLLRTRHIPHRLHSR